VGEVVDPVGDVEDDEQHGERGPRVPVDLVDVAHDRHALTQRQRRAPPELRQHLAPTPVRVAPVGRGRRLPRGGRRRGRRCLGRGVVGGGGGGVDLVEQPEASVAQSDGRRCRRHAAAGGERKRT